MVDIKVAATSILSPVMGGSPFSLLCEKTATAAVARRIVLSAYDVDIVVE
jgi:hypothetical protein